MSRIGKKNIVVPKGITVDSKEIEGRVEIVVKKGNQTLTRILPKGVKIEKTADGLKISDPGKEGKGFYGVSRTVVANMIQGLEKGFQKQLEINGVGYKAAVKGKELSLSLGFSHNIDFPIPSGIDIKVDQNTKMIITGADKDLVGQVSAKIRSFRPPEPYQGKGIKYSEEVIRRKEGKTAGK